MAENDDEIIGKINAATAGGAPQPPDQGGVDAFSQGLSNGATSMADGAQAMLATAKSGGLLFDPQTGQALIKTLNSFIDDLNLVDQDARNIAQLTPLGLTEGGKAMSTFNQQVAASGAKAFLPAHRQFIQALSTAVQAIEVAMDNYAKTDSDNAHNLRPKD